MAEHHLEASGHSPSARESGGGDDRAAPRCVVVLRVGVLVRAGDSRQLCLVRNISPGGMMIRAFSAVEPDEPVTVELRADRPLRGRIVWTREGDAGIRFDRTVDVGDCLAPPPLAPGWRARAPRIDVDRLAMIRAGSDISFASARNISQGGVRLACERLIERGTQIVLTLEGFRPVEGVVRWNRDGLCGISFNQALAAAELSRWLDS